MLCDECRRRIATVYVTRIVNGEKNQVYLCQECAREKGADAGFSQPHFSLQSLLSGLLSQQGVSATGTASGGSSSRCSRCGTEFSDFARTGFLGCSDCYEQFGSSLQSILRKIHGNQEHKGKIPNRAGGAVKLRRSVQELRDELKEKIEKEEYEKAALIRDRIKELEEELESGGGKG